MTLKYREGATEEDAEKLNSAINLWTVQEKTGLNMKPRYISPGSNKASPNTHFPSPLSLSPQFHENLQDAIIL